MLVSSFMTPREKVVSCQPHQSIRTALDLMHENGDVGSLVVTDDTDADDRPVGIMTTKDMLEAYRKGFGAMNHNVEEIMTKGALVSVADTMTKEQAANVLRKNKVHHAIVTDKEGKFVGIISTMDLTVEKTKSQ